MSRLLRHLALAAHALAAYAAVALGPPTASIVINAQRTISAGPLSNSMIGGGIEDVNHELVGGIYTQMVWGESFEEPAGPDGVSGSGTATRMTWSALSSSGCIFSVDKGDARTGVQSQRVEAPASTTCGLVNRGLDAGGLFFAATLSYSGYLFGKLVGGTTPANVTLYAVDSTDGTVLSSVSIFVAPGANWTRYAFTLGPMPRSTRCFDDSAPRVPCYANAENLCVSCSGQLQISLAGPSAVLIDTVFLGREAGDTRADVVSLLSAGQGAAGDVGVTPGMGYNAMRLGGSAILVDQYKWKRFRGPADARQPYTGTWYPYSSSGWGIFEFLQLCEGTVPPMAACVVTMNSAETPADVSDFLEYVYGPADSTVWGAQRAADGHPAPYHPFWVEVGNEQDHTSPAFIAQVTGFVAAMNATATRLRLPFRLNVVVGAMWIPWPPSQALRMATALSPFTHSMDVYWDFHIGGDNPAADPVAAFTFISSVAAVFANVSISSGAPPLRGVVLEENGGRHDMQRALGHARMSNRLHCLSDVVRIDTPANGLQVLGRNDNSWDQGQLFITQQGTYLSPAGMAQALLASSAALLSSSSSSSAAAASANAAAAAELVLVAVDAAALLPAPQLDVIALRDAEGAHGLAVRIVNVADAPVTVNVSIAGCRLTNGSATVLTVSSVNGNLSDTNTPAQPLRVTPVRSVVAAGAVGDAAPLFVAAFPPYSFTTINVQCNSAAEAAAAAESAAAEVAPPSTESRRFFVRAGAGKSGPANPAAVAAAGASDAAAAAAATTCDLPVAGAPSLSWLGHIWATYNAGPWAATLSSTSAEPISAAAAAAAAASSGSRGPATSITSANQRGPTSTPGARGPTSTSDAPSSPDILSLACFALHCYDQAVMLDAALPTSGGSWVSVSVSPGSTPPSTGQTQVAGVLVRCLLVGIGPGMDAFNCYEVSLGPNVNNNQKGSGYVMIGAHWLPSNFNQLLKVPWDVPAGTASVLNVSMTGTGASSVRFDVRVGGTLAASYTDTVHAASINGGHVALRSFYQDTTWTELQAAPLQPV